MGHELSGGFLEGVRDDFMVQVLEGPRRAEAELDLLVSGRRRCWGRW